MTVEVVQLRPHGSAGDIVKQLRNMADAIERDEVSADAAVCVLWRDPEENAQPLVYAWGRVPTTHDMLGRLADAQHYVMTQLRYQEEDEED